MNFVYNGGRKCEDWRCSGFVVFLPNAENATHKYCYITIFKSQSYFNMQMSEKGGGAVLWSIYSVQ